MIYTMNENLFYNDDSVLFVGEGNFSFALVFRRKISFVKCITASCLENEATSELTQQNIKELKNLGVKVVTGVDATKLTAYAEIVSIRPTSIIFNFPHVGGKMKIHKNRQLLKDFFASAAALLVLSNKSNIVPRRIIVSLCKGQGGTPADEEYLRNWGDTWQIVEMAAFSGLVLTHVEPFQHDLCPGYQSTGYRSRHINFHTEKSLVYVFEPQHPICIHPVMFVEDCMVTVSTKNGTIKCNRVYAENADFVEITSGYFVERLRANSLETFLVQNLKDLLETHLGHIECIPSSHLPLQCNASHSKVPCVTENNQSQWLRSSILEVLKVPDKGPFIAHGPVFQAFSQDFNEPPSRQQAAIFYLETDKVVHLVNAWLDCLLQTPLQIIKCNSLWGRYHAKKPIALKVGCYVIIELSTLACVKYSLHGFRDLLTAVSVDIIQCKLASLYPRSHVLDICFVEGADFEEELFLQILWQALGQWLVDATLLDVYEPPNQNWISRCYRLQYRSSKEALSRPAAINLHEKVLPSILIRSKLAKVVDNLRLDLLV